MKIPKKRERLYLTGFFVLIFCVGLYLINAISLGTERENGIKKIYYADHIFPVYQELIDQFNEKHKGEIEVVPVNLPSYTTNERKEVLTRYLRGNDVLDVFAVDQIWVPRFAKWGSNIDKYFGNIIKDSVISVALKSCYFKDKLVAVPINIDLSLMYYRKDLLDKYVDYEKIEDKIKRSITWKEFIELGKRANSDYPFVVFQADDYEGLVISFIELMYAQGKQLYENDSLQLNSIEAKRALKHLVDLVQKHKIAPEIISNLRENSSKKYFIENNALFLRGWPSFKNDFRFFTNQENILNNIEMAAVPHFENHKPVTMLGGWNMMISKYSKYKKEAAEFVKFVISESSQLRVYEERRQLPISKKLYVEKKYSERFPELEYFYELLNNGRYRPFREDYTKISDVISYYIYLAIKGDISVENALSEASKKINLGQVVIR